MPSTFDLLARPIQKWIRDQGWSELRPIQAETIRAIFAGEEDVIVSAATAGGKTEAAFLPLLSQVIDTPTDHAGFDLLYIGPLKALITDQAMRLSDICRETTLPVVPWHGDVGQGMKAKAIKSPRGVLMITPESLEALFIRRGMDIPRLFGATRAVVIDELHSVLDSERGVQMRSLLTRLELAVGHPIRRVGLSATLGDMDLAHAYLRPDNPAQVQLIATEGAGAELRFQLRGYVSGDENPETPSATDAIAEHLFRHLRGSDNLVFAGARQSVEIYADRLRELCDKAHLPQEFYAHHASLSRNHRDFVERRLKDPGKPTSAVCTSTLELGIDIGDVACVAQIGAPFTVAALRQRLGRSGRRAGQPAILRQYAVEARLANEASFADQLRLGFMRALAMIELLLEKWCEPPDPEALHLSTLVHQTLSIIAERGGAHANRLYRVLCQEGPFRQVDQTTFAQVLRALGQPEVALIEQSDEGLLLLGQQGEKLVNHFSFYAVFQTPEEYRLVSGNRDLGTVPVDNVLAPGMLLIFSGQRWVVREVIQTDRVIIVDPAKAGVPPVFGGDPGLIHDRVIEKIFELYENRHQPCYLDTQAKRFLDEARASYARHGFSDSPILSKQNGDAILATRHGSIATNTLALALGAAGFETSQHDGFLEVRAPDEDHNLIEVLRSIARGDPVDLFAHEPGLLSEKFHPFLTPELLQADALSARLDLDSLPELARALIDP